MKNKHTQSIIALNIQAMSVKTGYYLNNLDYENETY